MLASYIDFDIRKMASPSSTSKLFILESVVRGHHLQTNMDSSVGREATGKS